MLVCLHEDCGAAGAAGAASARSVVGARRAARGALGAGRRVAARDGAARDREEVGIDPLAHGRLLGALGTHLGRGRRVTGVRIAVFVAALDQRPAARAVGRARRCLLGAARARSCRSTARVAEFPDADVPAMRSSSRTATAWSCGASPTRSSSACVRCRRSRVTPANAAGRSGHERSRQAIRRQDGAGAACARDQQRRAARRSPGALRGTQRGGQRDRATAPRAARAEAASADAAIARGDPLGPLHGVPFTVKEVIGVAGMPTTNGSVLLRDRVASRDAEVVRRLRGAGAILLGKTNLSEFSAFWDSVNHVYGTTRNPHDLVAIAGSPGGRDHGRWPRPRSSRAWSRSLRARPAPRPSRRRPDEFFTVATWCLQEAGRGRACRPVRGLIIGPTASRRLRRGEGRSRARGVDGRARPPCAGRVAVRGRRPAALEWGTRGDVALLPRCGRSSCRRPAVAEALARIASGSRRRRGSRGGSCDPGDGRSAARLRASFAACAALRASHGAATRFRVAERCSRPGPPPVGAASAPMTAGPAAAASLALFSRGRRSRPVRSRRAPGRRQLIGRRGEERTLIALASTIEQALGGWLDADAP